MILSLYVRRWVSILKRLIDVGFIDMKKLTYNLLLIPISLVAFIGTVYVIFWLTLPDMFDVEIMDLNSDYNYKSLVQYICNEDLPDKAFDECQRNVIFNLNTITLGASDLFGLSFLFGVPVFFIYVFPIRKRVRKNW